MTNQPDSLESVVIGDGVVVKGTFTVPSKAVINGVIEGDLTAEEVLIGPTGRITGRVSAKVIDVRGQLHNTIISEKNLIVRSTGKIAGKVHYSEIEIEKGGEIEGSLSQDIEEMQAPNNNINNNVGAFQRQTQPQQMPSQTQVQNQAQSPRSAPNPNQQSSVPLQNPRTSIASAPTPNAPSTSGINQNRPGMNNPPQVG